VLLVVRSIREALELLGDQRRPWKWLLLVGISLLVAGLEAAGAALIYVLIGLVTMEGAALSLPLVGDLTQRFPDVPLRTLQVGAAIGVGGYFLLRAAVLVGSDYIQARLVQRAGARVADRLVRGYLAMPYLFMTQSNSSELVRNAFDSSQRFVSQVLTPLVVIVTDTIMVVGLTVILLAVSPTATLWSIAVLGPAVWLMLKVVQPRLKALGIRSQTARRESLRSLQHALGGFRDIRLLGNERYFASTFRGHRDELARNEYVKSALAAVPRALMETSLVILIVVVFVAAAVTGEGLEAMASTLGVFAYVGLRLQPTLRQIVGGLNTLRFGSAVLDDLAEDQRRLAQGQLPREYSRNRAEGLQHAIEVQNVSFAYPPGDSLALQEIDFRIRRGEFIGICGPTGGGKSTLIDLIVGLLEPTQGRILIDGQDLRGQERWWQAQLGVVSQSVFLVDDTLRRNIAFGRADEEVDEEALRRAVSRAQLEDVVAEMALGLDTVVGERGVRLSGGQRQRVAIARALYREPAVIVFDEGTSALDGATEAALVAALDELKSGRTIIAVAHRIATVRHADQILVVSGGHIAASGTYDELLAGSELFRSLAR
jgi:ATP-binding cassette, subfamily B, bacterial PglK